MAGFLRGLRREIVGAVAALAAASVPLPAIAISILGIDINGDMHSISTETGAYTTLGSTGLDPPDSLERAPDGQLYAVSRDAPTSLFAIDEDDFSIAAVASGNVLTGGVGGLAFAFDDLAFGTTRSILSPARLFQIDLSAGTLTAIGLIGEDEDIFALTLRDDGMLLGVARQSGSLLEIDPTTAATTVVSNLTGISVADFGGFVQTSEGLFFANSTLDGSVNEIWSVDPYTGAHVLESTISGLPGLKGLATIPEPSAAVLIGLGLTMLAAGESRRRVHLLTIAALSAFAALPPSASADEIEDFLNKACSSGMIGEAECEEMLACLEDPASCSSGGRNLSTTLRHRVSRFTELFLLPLPVQAG